ncbi:MAG: AAA family ATPase [Clostridia bacterium]
MLSDLYISGLRLDRQRLGEAGDRYFLSIPAIQNLDALDFHSRTTFFVGENGTGKSTLLEAIAVKIWLQSRGRLSQFFFFHKGNPFAPASMSSSVKGIRRPQNGFFCGRRALQRCV